jgi:hypothetical protein
MSGGRLLYPEPEDAPYRGDKEPTLHGLQCNIVAIFPLVIIKSDSAVFSWHHNIIILKPKIYFMIFIKGVLNIRDEGTLGEIL